MLRVNAFFSMVTTWIVFAAQAWVRDAVVLTGSSLALPAGTRGWYAFSNAHGPLIVAIAGSVLIALILSGRLRRPPLELLALYNGCLAIYAAASFAACMMPFMPLKAT